ncbi:MAG: hypothetical protein ACLQO6_04060, partial [Desulfomonilaceae bacterium]
MITHKSRKYFISLNGVISHDSSYTSRVTHYRSFYDENDELFDQGIILYFKAPHSFTGEDVVELQVHGSPIVLDKLVQLCVQK